MRYIALVALLLVCGCSGRDPADIRKARGMKRVQYGNHTYVVWESGVGDSSTGGILHDPDCACNGKVEAVK